VLGEAYIDRLNTDHRKKTQFGRLAIAEKATRDNTENISSLRNRGRAAETAPRGDIVTNINVL
jgi:hypothetical protein